MKMIVRIMAVVIVVVLCIATEKVVLHCLTKCQVCLTATFDKSIT